MKDLETNKILASLLVAGLLAIGSGKIAGLLYSPELSPEKRGYAVEVAEDAGANQVAKEEVKIDLASLMANADAGAGEKGFKKCAACHSINEGGAHKVGPKLYGVVGSKVAQHADYAYSQVLKDNTGNWDYENLFAFITKPKKYAPGTKMSFIGIKKPEKVANLIAYLRANGSSNYPLPVATPAVESELSTDNTAAN